MRGCSIGFGLLLILTFLVPDDAGAQSTFERGSDRRTVNDRMFRLPRPAPRLCQDMCFRDEACRSWTYVEFGEPVASCWLGDTEQDRRPDDCCVAGIVR
jgi:hypothetical protein